MLFVLYWHWRWALTGRNIDGSGTDLALRWRVREAWLWTTDSEHYCRASLEVARRMR